MREIKFRAWDDHKKKMYSFDELDFLDQFKEVHFYTLIKGEYADIKPSEYTGLKDKNGVEIYEGDILKGLSKETPNGRWTVLDRVYYTNRGTWDCDSFLLGDTNETCEVIGNIYKNPELLETK